MALALVRMAGRPMTRCPSCGLRLTDGRCPADLPTLPTHAGREYGTAQQLVHRLGSDVTVDMIRNWRRRDGLTTIAGHSPLDEATAIERDKRLSGRGRGRRVDVGLPAAA